MDHSLASSISSALTRFNLDRLGVEFVGDKPNHILASSEEKRQRNWYKDEDKEGKPKDFYDDASKGGYGSNKL